MKSSALIRTGSVNLAASLSRTSSLFSPEKVAAAAFPRICLQLDPNSRRDRDTIRRALSESKILRSDSGRLKKVKSPSPGNGIPEDEMDFYGGNSMVTSAERENVTRMGEYYQEMLKSNPSDALLLRNYAQFLHEVEKDMVQAEEYYSRAILASPGDGEVLSLYGKLIWETQKDKDRARSYFDCAVAADPNNCMVLGSFASFMWEAEEDEEDDEEFNIEGANTRLSSAPELVPAF